MSDNYQYKKGICIHCGRKMWCSKGVAHFKCSYRAQRMLDLVDVMVKYRDPETEQHPEHYRAWDLYKRLRYGGEPR